MRNLDLFTLLNIYIFINRIQAQKEIYTIMPRNQNQYQQYTPNYSSNTSHSPDLFIKNSKVQSAPHSIKTFLMHILFMSKNIT